MSWSLFRFWLGREIANFGFSVMPAGRVRDELTELLSAWSRSVRAEIAASGMEARRAASEAAVHDSPTAESGDAR